MEITEVNVKLIEDKNERVLAFCSVTFDNSFVVRDVKIIEGANNIFVAMPSRKVSYRCPRCKSKNHLKSNYCSHCGDCLEDFAADFSHKEIKLYVDVAHPINTRCREDVQKRVLDAYHKELELSKLPGYVPSCKDMPDEAGIEQVAGKPHFGQSAQNIRRNAAQKY